MPDTGEEAGLVKRLRESDLEAFEVLFKRYQPLLFRSVLYQVRDPDNAHDIVQETFVRVWEHRTSLKPGLSFVAFLYRISRNLVTDRQRHEGMQVRSMEHIPLPIPPPDSDPEAAADHALLSAAVRHVLRNDLPDRCRIVFEYSRLEGLNNREIAERLGITEKTVENQLTKALRILQRKLRRLRNP